MYLLISKNMVTKPCANKKPVTGGVLGTHERRYCTR